MLLNVYMLIVTYLIAEVISSKKSDKEYKPVEWKVFFNKEYKVQGVDRWYRLQQGENGKALKLRKIYDGHLTSINFDIGDTVTTDDWYTVKPQTTRITVSEQDVQEEPTKKRLILSEQEINPETGAVIDDTLVLLRFGQNDIDQIRKITGQPQRQVVFKKQSKSDHFPTDSIN